MSNEEQKPPMSNRVRRLFIGAFSILTCGTAWLTARSFTRAAAAERLAKSGHETNFRMYEVNGKYPSHFVVTVIAVVMLIATASRKPGPLVLRQPSSIAMVAVQLSSIAFAAVQMLLRIGDRKCAVSGASYVLSLGWILTCDDSEASLATPNYAKMMAYSANEWRYALFVLTMFTAFPIFFSWMQVRARRNQSQEQLDEKTEVSC